MKNLDVLMCLARRIQASAEGITLADIAEEAGRGRRLLAQMDRGGEHSDLHEYAAVHFSKHRRRCLESKSNAVDLLGGAEILGNRICFFGTRPRDA